MRIRPKKFKIKMCKNIRNRETRTFTHACMYIRVRNIHPQYGLRLLSASYDIDFAFSLTCGHVES